jgi:hypothetical protein
MCFGGTKAKNEADLKAMQERKAMESANSNDSGDGNTYTRRTGSTYRSPSSSDNVTRPRARPVVRPQARTGNAYRQSTGRRLNPSLFQRVLDTSPTYNAASYLSRRFDPRG